MTLVLAMVNTKEAILVSDRRLTSNGKVVESPDGEAESNKAISLVRPDARLLIAYTGLATSGRFSTHKWLCKTLVDLAEPDLPIKELIARLAEQATRDIGALSVSSRDRRLSIVFAGYQLGDDPPRGSMWLVTNFEDPLTPGDGEEHSNPATEARSSFDVSSIRERRPHTSSPCMLCAIGDTDALSDIDFLALGKLVRANKSRQAVTNRAVNAVRTAAKNSRSGLIGRQCTSLALPRDFTQLVDHTYHSEKESWELPGPAVVLADDPNGFKTCVWGVSTGHEPTEPTVPPVTFGKVPRNSPCPCGSGVKFKKCHGAQGVPATAPMTAIVLGHRLN